MAEQPPSSSSDKLADLMKQPISSSDTSKHIKCSLATMKSLINTGKKQTTEITLLKERETALNRKFERTEQRNQDLERQVSAFLEDRPKYLEKTLLDENASVKRSIGIHQDEMRRRMDLITELAEENLRVKGEIQSKGKIITELTDENMLYDGRVSELTGEMNGLMEKNQSLQNKAAKLAGEKQEMGREIARLREENESLKASKTH